jgi:hypothetical protein
MVEGFNVREGFEEAISLLLMCTHSPFEKKVYVSPRLLFFYYVHDHVQIYLFCFYLFNFSGMIHM